MSIAATGIRSVTWIPVLLLAIFTPCASPGGVTQEAKQVVVVLMDGLRPDFVTEQNTPTLWKLAQDGVTFRKHHAVYPSATHVNGVALMDRLISGTQRTDCELRLSPRDQSEEVRLH